jgi:hypothetical protein
MEVIIRNAPIFGDLLSGFFMYSKVDFTSVDDNARPS